MGRIRPISANYRESSTELHRNRPILERLQTKSISVDQICRTLACATCRTKLFAGRHFRRCAPASILAGEHFSRHRPEQRNCESRLAGNLAPEESRVVNGPAPGWDHNADYIDFDSARWSFVTFRRGLHPPSSPPGFCLSIWAQHVPIPPAVPSPNLVETPHSCSPSIVRTKANLSRLFPNSS